MKELRIVCDAAPGPDGCLFIEVEDADGKSIRAGKWRERPDGFWELVIRAEPTDDYQAWYAEAIEASNNLGFAGMSAAAAITYLGGEAADLRAQCGGMQMDLDEHRVALQAVTDCLAKALTSGAVNATGAGAALVRAGKLMAGGWGMSEVKARAELAALRQPVANEREAFEQHYRHFDLSSDPVSGAYFDCEVRCLWDAWQARAALSAPPAGQPIRMPPPPYLPDVEPASLTDYERGEAQGRCDMWAMVKELNAAGQDVSALTLDAERYRWLRNPTQDVSLVLDKVTGAVPSDEFGCGGYRTYEYRAGEELDSAIDAALAAPAAGQDVSALVEALEKCVASLDQLLPYLGKVPADVGLLNDALVSARPILAARKSQEQPK